MTLFCALAFEVAPAAACTGVQLFPSQNVATKINSGPTNTTYCFTPGLYRLRHSIVPRPGVDLIGAPSATLSGAKRVTDWRRAGSVWIASRQTQGPTLNQGAPGGRLVRPQARYNENLFRDGRWLRKVGVKVNGHVIGAGPSTVGRGEYFFDYDRNRITLGSTPRGHVLEAAVVTDAIRSGSAGVVVSHLTVQMAAGWGVRGGGSGWTIADVTARDNATVGATIQSDGTIRDSVLVNNGQYGVFARGHNGLVARNEVAYNNRAGLRQAPDRACNATGGSKFWATVGLRVVDNYFHDNFCNAIWFDGSSFGGEVAGNRVERNRGIGVTVEISYAVTVHHNTIKENQSWGILVRSSPDVTAHNNIVYRNGYGGIMLLDKIRSDHPSAHGVHRTKNADIYRNTITTKRSNERNGGLFEGFPWSGDMFGDAYANRFHGNTWRLRSLGDTAFRWDRKQLNSAGWKAAGNDQDGTFQIGTG